MTTSRPGLKSLAALCASFLMAGSLGSCSLMHDDHEPCPEGLDVSFSYSHNLSATDRFAAEVKGVTVFVYDAASGKFVTAKEESGAALAKNGYAMHLPLQAGKYKLVAVAHEGDFASTVSQAGGAQLRRIQPGTGDLIDDFRLVMDRDENSDVIHREVPLAATWMNLGAPITAEVVNGEDSPNLTVSTAHVALTRITNKLHLTMHQIDFPTQMDVNSFEVSLVDRNGNINADNSLLDDEELSYYPRAVTAEEYTETEGAKPRMQYAADIDFPRFLHFGSRAAAPSAGPALVIKDRLTGLTTTITDLTDKLLVARDGYEDHQAATQGFITQFGAQDFFDRCYEYELHVALEGRVPKYVEVRISVLRWSKRIQLVDFGITD